MYYLKCYSNLLYSVRVTVNSKLEQLFCEQFLQGLKISRAFLRAKKVLKEKRWKIQNPVIITHKTVFLIYISHLKIPQESDIFE